MKKEKKQKNTIPMEKYRFHDKTWAKPKWTKKQKMRKIKLKMPKTKNTAKKNKKTRRKNEEVNENETTWKQEEEKNYKRIGGKSNSQVWKYCNG